MADNDTVCVGWAIDNIDRYVTPTLEHLVLVVVSVAVGFAIALAMALLSHRRRWLVPTFTGATGVIYTIPSIALFLLLLPITGRGTVTAIIALTLYTLQIIYRNIVTGLANVPEAAKDAGRGMGMTDRQLLWRVELPLAVPEIIAGLRIATVSTVAIATLAVFAGAGGLGAELYARHHLQDRDRRLRRRSRSRWRSASTCSRRCPAAALARGAGCGRYDGELLIAGLGDRLVRRTRSSSSSSPSRAAGGGRRGRRPRPGLGADVDADLDQRAGARGRLSRSRSRSGSASATAGTGELLAVAIGNAGRAIPELALIAFMVAFIGVGVLNVTIALLILGIPPILTNTFVGVRQVDRDAVEAARGMGMTRARGDPQGRAAARGADDHERRAHRGDQHHRHGDDRPARRRDHARRLHHQPQRLRREGVLAGAILVALLALAVELALAGLQRLLTPRGLELEREPPPRATA